MGIGRIVEGLLRNPWVRRGGLAATMIGAGVGCRGAVDRSDTRPGITIYRDSNQIEALHIRSEVLSDPSKFAETYLRSCGITLPADPTARGEVIKRVADLFRGANPDGLEGTTLREAGGLEKFNLPPSLDLVAISCPPCVQTGAAQPVAGSETPAPASAATWPNFDFGHVTDMLIAPSIKAGASLAQPINIDLPPRLELVTYSEGTSQSRIILIPVRIVDEQMLPAFDKVKQLSGHADGGKIWIDSLQWDRSVNPASSTTNAQYALLALVRLLEEALPAAGQPAASGPSFLRIDFEVEPAVAGSSGGGHGGGQGGTTTPAPGPINIQTPDNPFGIR